MTLESLKDLYVQQLKDLYSAEKQLIKALPKMAKGANAPELKKAIEQHLEETEEQLNRLKELFDEMGLSPSGHKCKAMEGLIAEADEMLDEKGDPDVLDAGLIANAQRVEHYEMAGYGCVRTYAKQLGYKKAMKTLQTTLDEEAACNDTLTELAESLINVRATEQAHA